MNEPSRRVGFAFCGSFCTFHKAIAALEKVKARFGDVTAIVSENSAALDTRFGAAHDFMREMERICDKRVIDSLTKAEPLGPKKLLDVLVICPCTGNTLGKLAAGIADTTVTLAAKAHLRNGRPLVIAVSTMTLWPPPPRASARCWTRKTSTSSPSARTIPPASPPLWCATFPWCPIPSPPPWRAASSSPCSWVPPNSSLP